MFNFKNHIYTILKSNNLTLPKKMKGIFGLTNEFKIPEPLEKGILRAKNEVLVYKTAEIRYDATDIPLTHFKPNEIGTSIEKLKQLGYNKDYEGKPLIDENQILELKVQDILLSDDCANYFIKVANFLDDELEYFYKLNRFYNITKREDLIGHLVVGLAPHTSAGIIGRVIGFSPERSIYAHPFWLAAKRRTCEGEVVEIARGDDGTVDHLFAEAALDFICHGVARPAIGGHHRIAHQQDAGILGAFGDHLAAGDQERQGQKGDEGTQHDGNPQRTYRAQVACGRRRVQGRVAAATGSQREELKQNAPPGCGGAFRFLSLQADQASAALACAAMALNASGSCTARSARTLRSTSIPALARPLMNLE